METIAEKRRHFSHKESILTIPGREGETPIPYSGYGKTVAVFTSGGDSQGMNAAVRAIVRMGIYLGCKVYFIKEGYQGMVDGGENIEEATWHGVSGIIEQGGTIIGSARCADFRERPGRLRAAKNLISCGITNLVCIGGDGTLTGANTFRKEWAGLLEELRQSGEITEEQMLTCSHLNIVGLIGSIDNDFCGTDMTIGVDTALHRIIEAVDAISTTATSHQRCFVLEVMGRHCGYLALVAAMATEADFVCIPESPNVEGWEEKLCNKLRQEREIGQRLNIIIVAEGAIDSHGKPVSATDVKNLITKNLGYDTRITVLGHVQRGGNPSAFDRILATRMGAEAVMAVIEAGPDTPACVIALDGNQIVRKSLMECVERTLAVQTAMKSKDFEKCVTARGRSFANNLSTYKILSRLEPSKLKANSTFPTHAKLNLAVVAVGAPACGANAAVRSFVRTALVEDCTVYGVYDSMAGLANGNLKAFEWKDVHGWASKGGSMLGTRRTLPKTVGLAAIANTMKSFNISGLMILGGFEAYQSAIEIIGAREEYESFNIPILVVPSTISNNVPGTDFSLGCDTSINEIVNICDRIKQSASGSKRRVFVVETMGGYCGYLATLSALAGGADAAYINEEHFSCDDLQNDVDVLKMKVERSEIQRGLILVNEKANENYSTEFIHRLFSEEGKGFFTTRMNVLGHMQQGGSASPFDRNMGTKFGVKAAHYLVKKCIEVQKPDGTVWTNAEDSACLLGVVKRQTEYTPISQLVSETNFSKRIPKNQWWLKLRSLLRIMARHDAVYTKEAVEDSHTISTASSFVQLAVNGKSV